MRVEHISAMRVRLCVRARVRLCVPLLARAFAVWVARQGEIRVLRGLAPASVAVRGLAYVVGERGFGAWCGRRGVACWVEEGLLHFDHAGAVAAVGACTLGACVCGYYGLVVNHFAKSLPFARAAKWSTI